MKIPEGAVSIKYRVPYADTDMMGVVYYGNYLTLFERCRNELMRGCGVSYGVMEKDMKIMMPVVEAHVDYRKPARYDDVLEISGWVAYASGARVKVCCAVCRDGEELASGYTVHACVSSETFRPVRVPEYVASSVIPE